MEIPVNDIRKLGSIISYLQIAGYFKKNFLILYLVIYIIRYN